MLMAIADVHDEHQAGLHAKARAEIYHFLELALAHPGELGYEFFTSSQAETGLVETVARLPRESRLSQALEACRLFLATVKVSSFDEVEAAHISLFSSNFPVVPCPPYGSLFTVEEPKRLEEMMAIKKFYRDVGIEIAPSFDDLPDHLCVELEVMHLLSFRECEASSERVAAGVRAQQVYFVDRFMQPFVNRLADIATRYQSTNPYSNLLNATRFFLADHRAQLGEASSGIERHVQ
ncbi:MAG: molecular chaperone TorD family protein [Hyphomicrobiaceae bacterium]|nr:molecular chaperone TorD family protein [Hyphomicrobiaceae bacterium]